MPRWQSLSDIQLGNNFNNLGKPEIYNEKIQEAKNEKEEIFKTNGQKSLNNLNVKVKNIKKVLINEWNDIYSIANDQMGAMTRQQIAEKKVEDGMWTVITIEMSTIKKFNDEKVLLWEKDIQK